MTREIKFRAWDKNIMILKMLEWEDLQEPELWSILHGNDNYILMQYTGLKDKNGLTEVYEGDIIDEEGNIKGNIYEMDKKETDFVIQGLGTNTWCETYRRAIFRGCKDAE